MDLKSLSPAAKRELARLLLMQRQHQAGHALQRWVPWEPDQGADFRSQARTRLVIGGNRSGKTESGAADTAHLFQGTHPHRENKVPMKIKVLAMDFPNALRNTIIPKLIRFIPKGFIARTEHNQQGVTSKLVGVNDSVIDFMSYDQDVTKFESFDADHAWFDEPPPEAIYKAVRRGLIDRQGSMLFTLTPLYEPWIYHTLWVPAEAGELTDTECFVLPTAKNPHLKATELDSIREIYSDEEQEVRLEGKFKHLSGLIYKQFRRETHVLKTYDWPKDWPVYFCLDPHVKKAHALTWMGVTPDEDKVVIDEMAFDGDIAALAMKVRTHESQRRYRVVDRLVDTSINAINRQDNLRILREAGLRCRFPKKHDTVLPGIEDVRSALTPRTVPGSKEPQPSLYVFDRCPKHIRQFMSYVWAEPPATAVYEREAPRKKEDDYMDNVRYLISIKPRYHYQPEIIDYSGGMGTYGVQSWGSSGLSREQR